MFRRNDAIIVVAIASALWSGTARGQESTVTLKGEILCAHCLLGEGTKCQTAIQVKENDKKVTYYFADKGVSESYHKAVCGGGAKAGTVTGVITEKEGKKWITPKKVEYTAVKSSHLNWEESYGAGLARGVHEKKPLAVVVGSGLNGWEKLTTDSLSTDAEKMLTEEFVAVYVDCDTPAGKKLANELGISRCGIVLSNRTCDAQAFCHQGAMSCANLSTCLQKHCGAAMTGTTPFATGSAGVGHEHHSTGSATASTVPASATKVGSCPNCHK